MRRLFQSRRSFVVEVSQAFRACITEKEVDMPRSILGSLVSGITNEVTDTVKDVADGASSIVDKIFGD